MPRQTWDPTILVVILAAAMVAGVVLATGGLGEGEWRAKQSLSRDVIRLDFRPLVPQGQIRIGTDVAVRELAGFDPAMFEQGDRPVRFSWKHDAGAIVFEGTGGRRPGGTVRFEPDPSFRQRWQALGLSAPADGDLLAFALEDVKIEDAERMLAIGYTDLRADDLARLRAHDIDMVWVEGMQAIGSRPSIDALVRLRAHGVDVDDVREVAELGLKLDVEELIRYRNHGIDARYVKGMIDAGMKAGDHEAIRRLHSHGISPDFVAAVRAAGLVDASLDELTRLHNHGVSPDYVRGAMTSGLPGLSVEEIVRLAAHGVSTAEAKSFVESGPGKRGVEAVITLHNHGVDEDWARGMTAEGYGELAIGELTRLHAHGVTPAFVRELAARGHKNLPPEQLIQALSRGADWIERPDHSPARVE